MIIVDLNDSKYIVGNEDMSTSAAGIFVAGDVRKKNFETNCHSSR